MKLTDIKTITNVGAGTMGHATALQFALAGYPVRLYETTRKPDSNTVRRRLPMT